MDCQEMCELREGVEEEVVRLQDKLSDQVRINAHREGAKNAREPDATSQDAFLLIFLRPWRPRGS